MPGDPLDDALSILRAGGGSSAPTRSRMPRPEELDGGDDLFGAGMSALEANRPPSFGERAASVGGKVLHGVGAVVGAPKAGTDWLMRKSAKLLYDMDLPDDFTTGKGLRQGLGLNPEDIENQTYGRRLAGGAAEFGGDLVDPLLPAMGGAGAIAKEGQLAGRVLSRVGAEAAPEVLEALSGVARAGEIAAPIEKGAQAAFGGLMTVSAVESGKRLYDTYMREGMTPAAAEEALHTVLGAGMAAHVLSSVGHGPSVDPFAEFNADPARPPRPEDMRGMDLDQRLAEREALTPDLGALQNAEQARLARSFVEGKSAADQPLTDAITGALTGPAGEPRLSARVPPMSGEGSDLASFSPEAAAEAGVAPPVRPAYRAPLPSALLEPTEARAPGESDRPALAAPEVLPESPPAVSDLQAIEPTTEPLPAEVRIAEPEPIQMEARVSLDRRQVPDASGAEDRRLADRRKIVAESLGRDKSDPIVERVAQAEHEARTDPLTGLGNKRAWEETQKMMDQNDHVLLLDMKQFKPINDKLGHAAGDQVLQHTADLIREHITDEASRYGGDEFGIPLHGVTSPEEARAIADSFQEKARRTRVPVTMPDGTVVDLPGVEVHIGVGRGEHAAAEADAALNAGAAESRAGGRGDKALEDLGGPAPGAVGGAEGGRENLGAVPHAQVTAGAPEFADWAKREGAQADAEALAKYVEAHPDATVDQRAAGRQDIAQAREKLDALEAKRAARKTWVGGHSHGNTGSGDVAAPRLGTGARMAPTSDELVSALRASVKANGDQPVFAAEAKGAPERPAIGRPEIARAFKGAEVTDHPEGGHAVKLANGRTVRVLPDATIELQPGDRAAFAESARAKGLTADKAQPAGSYSSIPAGGIIRLAKGSGAEKLDHETFHAAMELALNDKERAAVVKKYGSEENAAHAYESWTPKVQNGLFGRIYSFFNKVYRSFFPDAETVFERVKSGEAFGRKAAPEAKVEPAKFAAAPKPKEAPEAKPIDLDRIGTDKTVKQTLAEMAGRIKDEPTDMAKLVNESGLTPQQFAKVQEAHGPKTARMLRAGMELRRAAAEDVLTKMEAAKTATDRLQGDLDFARAVTRAGAVTAETIGSHGAKAAMAAHQMMSEQLRPGERMFDQILRAHPAMDPKTREALSKAIKGGDQAQIIAATQKAISPTRMDKFLEFWKAGLVSGPPTIAGNILSNAVFEGWRTAERSVTGAIDAFLSKVQGREQERFASEGIASLASMRTALPDALKLVWNGHLKEQIQAGTKYEGKPGAIGGKVGEVVRLPFRSLQAWDDGAKHMAAQNELFATAFRMATREKKAGKLSGTVPTRMADIIERVGKYGESKLAREAGTVLDEAATKAMSDREAGLVYAAMDKAAHEATFQDEVGRFTKIALDARRAASPLGIPLGDIIAPFMKTPSRILVQAAKRTPLGLVEAAKVWRGVKEGTRTHGELSEALAKPMMGTMLGIGFYAAARQGLITGGGPNDDAKRKLLESTGWQPYSVKVGDSYVQYKRLEPLATVLGLAADMAEASDEKEAGSIAEKLQGSLIQNITEKSWLTGFTNLSQAWNDPKRYGATWVRSLEGSLIPNVIRKAAAAVDPEMRDTRSALGPILAGIPGLSETLPARTQATGAVQERPGTALERFASPFPRTEEKSGTELERAMLDLDYTPSPVSNKLHIPGSKVSVDLTRQEMDMLNKADQDTSKRLRQVVTSGAWRALDSDAQKEYLAKQYAAGRARARAMLYQIPSFQRKAKDAIREHANANRAALSALA